MIKKHMEKQLEWWGEAPFYLCPLTTDIAERAFVCVARKVREVYKRGVTIFKEIPRAAAGRGKRWDDPGVTRRHNQLRPDQFTR
jgi:hypothetical protein